MELWSRRGVLLVFLASGCGSSPSLRAPEAEIVTDRDPLPYTPPPSAAPTTGQPVGIAVASRHEEARAVATQLLRAIRDGDEGVLSALLADPVLTVFPRLGAGARSRAELLERILRHPQRGLLTPETPIEELGDLAQLEVASLAQEESRGPMPSSFDESDLLVTFPLGPTGTRALRALIGWPSRGGFVLRLGTPPVIVAL